ncbi:hypothetical protein C5D25_00975 [Rathayibacter sp. AY1D7]|uniref:Eco57I restriction-modification methylase domain-containing protein n=1 Tax=unclassified Rathayibacter TaxID=2609250 RepID=UPI000CE7CE7F|nr:MULTISPECIES: N-6 DNA methylase [unclassified Rathayibacter]PPF18482.1 hypothetical protein C5B92_06420 [Rathayibacter sp. AY1A4]PPH67341.1 hypothetical protein C5D25_00975 [Rathayibacter sp. AY1D7]
MNGDLLGIRLIGGVLPSALLGRIQANELSNAQGLSGSSYHLVGNEKPRDAAARAWSYLRGAWTAWRDIAAKEVGLPGTGTARDKWLLVLLDELGYGRLPATRQAEQIDGVEYPISHRWHHVPIHLLGPGIDLDRRNPGVPGAARAPQAMLQEYLNRTDADLWGILSNGLRLRLLRDSTAFAGSAYVEFDLEAIFDGELYSEFQLLWLLCHVSRLEKRGGGADAAAADCWLEEWRTEAAEAGTRALNRLRGGVEFALKIFGTGFLAHPSNDWLRAGLQKGTLSDRDYQKALLRLIYRLLFAFVAEDRGALLDPAAPREQRERYDEYFSTSRLRKLSRLSTGGTHPDLWRGQRMILAALGDKGLSQLGVPALGGLFDPDRRAPVVTGSPHRDLLLGAELTNKDTLAAIRRLAWIIVPGQRTQPIDYRHLGAEELGGVYESLLELVPRIDLDSREFGLVHLSGNERKTTGSYYTPPSLVSALLDASLDPALDDAVQAGRSVEEKEANLLAVTVCDPASGSGGFLVAAARRIARRLAQVRSDEDEPTPETVRHALHDVIARCIYGVDMNDLAAELAKVSLWLEALEPGRPLGFLDARIRIGNSLFGSTPALLAKGVPDKAFVELEGDQKAYAAQVRKRNKNEATGQGLLSWVDSEALAAESLRDRGRLLAPSDDVDAIRARGEQWDLYLDSDARRALKRQADAWAGAFVWPLVDGTPLPPTSSVVRAMIDDTSTTQYAETVEKVEELATEYRFFHWHLEFPEIFGATTGDGLGPNGWAGGFSCMLGNPPWEQIELKETEFFAPRAPEIAQAAGSKRKSLITQLSVTDPILDRQFRDEKRSIDGLRAFVSAGRYPLAGRGRVNTYAVFAELFVGLTAPTGRAGVIVPTGVATDATTQYFFKDLVQTESLAALFDFENRKKLFTDVDSRFKFCILSTTGRDLRTPAAQFAFFLDDPELIESSRFELTPEEIMCLNPNTGTIPIFRTRRDAEITLGIYRRVPVLINENDPVNGNPWGISFMQGLFNMTSDSHLFHTRDALEADGWTLNGNIFERDGNRMLPLYEAKMLNQFDHRDADVVKSATAAKRQNQPRYFTPADHRDPLRLPLSMAWVAEGEVPRLGHSWLIGFSDVTSATNERTILASALPMGPVGHTYPLMFGKRRELLLAQLNSYPLDYVARQKVAGLHLTYGYVKQLPFVGPAALAARFGSATAEELISPRVRELVFTSWNMSDFARDLGDHGAPFVWDEARRETIRAELDAMFFHLFRMPRDEVDYVLDTFWTVKRKDEAEFGEYRTKRLILENYDCMQECIDDGTKFVSTLDPAPGLGPRHRERTIDA